MHNSPMPAKKPIKKLERKPRPERTAIQEFVGNRKPTLETVDHLIKSIQGMVTEAKTRSDVLDGYKKTSEQMVKAGKIKVIYRNSGPHFGMSPKYGCYQMSSILYTAMKEIGLSPKMTRFFLAGTPHTTVLFRINGRLYEADPFESMFYNVKKGDKVITTDAPPFSKVDKFRRKEISDLMKKNKFRFIRPGQYTKKMYDRERRTGKLAV